MGITGPITALGHSYGGPIAVMLALLDARIDMVALGSAYPMMKDLAVPFSLLIRTGLRPLAIRLIPRRGPRTGGRGEIVFDPAYDVARSRDLTPFLFEIVRRTPLDRRESLLLEYASLRVRDANGGDEAVLTVLILQVIGEQDRV